MLYKTKDFSHLFGLGVLSEELLKTHFKLYEGYINNCNKIIETLSEYCKSEKIKTLEFAELKRRFGWEMNGLRLHELYFENLTKESSVINDTATLTKKISEDFGDFKSWYNDFEATVLMRGIGWAVLYYEQEGNRLFNTWINEHDVGHLSGAVPLLVVDAFEHAYLADYGSSRADYLSAIKDFIDWNEVENRYKKYAK
jgi:Fe-Mn family superoxide dismutase